MRLRQSVVFVIAGVAAIAASTVPLDNASAHGPNGPWAGHGQRTVKSAVGWTTFAPGASHVCALGWAGSLWCWGTNHEGQLGTSSTDDQTRPVRIGTETWRAVSAAGNATCAIRIDRSLWCWGARDNWFGTSRTPVQIDPGTSWSSISLGAQHVCGIRTDRSLWCAGKNDLGQLGDGTTTARQQLTRVGSDRHWVSMSSGSTHTCAIRQDRALWCWGDNSELQIDGQASTSYSTPVRVAAGTFWRSVAADRGYTCGIRLDESLWCWGSHARGDGQDVIHQIPFQVGPGTRWSTIHARDEHICGVQTSGSLWCWGDNYLGWALPGVVPVIHLAPTRVGTKSYWRGVAEGTNFICGLRSDTSLWCWGGNSEGQLGDGTRVSSWEIPVQTQIGRAANWTTISGGEDHTCGVRSDHSLWCWGGNGYGQLGDGTTTDRSAPVRVLAAPGTRGWSEVGAGEHMTCAIATNGSLWCWGSLQEASDRSGRVTTPVQLGVDLTWRTVAVGTQRACAITTQGAVWCWGNRYPFRSDKPYDNLVAVGTGAVWTQVTAGLLFMCGIQSDGSLWCWDEHFEPPPLPGDIPKWFQTGLSPKPKQYPGTWTYVARPYSALRAIRADGSLWYSNPQGTPQPVDETAWTTIAYDWQNICGIRPDHTLWCTTYSAGNLDIAVGPPNFWNAVSLQSGYVCGIARDHTLWCGRIEGRGTDIDLENRSHQVLFPGVTGRGAWATGPR